MTLGYGTLEEIWSEFPPPNEKKKKKTRKSKMVDPVCKLYNSRNAPKDKPFNSNWVNNTKKLQSSKGKVRSSNLNEDVSIWTPHKYDVNIRKKDDDDDDETYLDEAIYREFGNHNRKSATQEIYNLDEVYNNYLGDNDNNGRVKVSQCGVANGVANILVEDEDEVEDEVEVEEEEPPLLIKSMKNVELIDEIKAIRKNIDEMRRQHSLEKGNKNEPCVSELIIFVVAGIILILLMENAISLGEKISIRRHKGQ